MRLAADRWSTLAPSGVAERWSVGEILATIAHLRPAPPTTGQPFGGVAITEKVRLKALRFAMTLHAEFRQYVEPPQITATIDGGIAFRWRRDAGPTTEGVDVEVVFVRSETEYAVTPVGDTAGFIDEGATQSMSYLIREVVKRYLIV